MAIKSAAEMLEDMQTNILTNKPKMDTSEGSVARDVSLNPVVNQMEDMYAELEHVSLIHSLYYPDEMSSIEMDRLVYNWGITRNEAIKATGTCVGRRSTVPTESITIPTGKIVSTSKDANGNTIKFVSSAEVTYAVADASSYYNSATGFYEYPFSVEAQNGGTAGTVAIGQITILEDSIPGIDGVYNNTAIAGGSEEETNAALASRTLIALTGNNIGTEDGYITFVEDYDLVYDAVLVGPGDDLMARDSNLGGKCDVYVNIDTAASGVLTTATDSYTYEDLSTGGLGATDSANDRRLESRPVYAITSIVGSISGTFTEGTEWEFVEDDGNLALSTESQDKIRWLTNGPVAGETISINYSYYLIIETIQTAIDLARIITADVKIKVATSVEIDVTMSVLADSSITNSNTFSATIVSAIEDHLTRRTLSGKIEQSDIIALVHSISGTDSLVVPLTLLAISGESGTSDIQLEANQFSIAGNISVNVTLASS